MSANRGSPVFQHPLANCFSHLPRDGVGVQQVSKKFAHIPQFVGLQAVDVLILVTKYLLKWRHILLVNQTESLQVGGSMLRSVLLTVFNLVGTFFPMVFI